MGMKQFFERITGLDKIRKAAETTTQEALKLAEDAKEAARVAVEEAKKAQEEEVLQKLTPKERATRKNEPWVGVLETHINKDNIRNGFFELDWNNHFVLKLKQEGYGYDGDRDEEIVDRWFRELCANVVVEDNLPPVTSGVIDINSVLKNKK